MDLEYQYFLFEIMVLGVVFIGLAYLLALAIIVRDYKLIVERPLIFVIELLLMSLLPGIPILFFVVSRGITWTKAWVWFVSLSTKFAIFHVLSQLAGFYSWIFS